MRVVAPRPMIAFYRLQTLECSGLTRRMTTVLNIIPNYEKIKLSQRFAPLTHNTLFSLR